MHNTPAGITLDVTYDEQANLFKMERSQHGFLVQYYMPPDVFSAFAAECFRLSAKPWLDIMSMLSATAPTPVAFPAEQVTATASGASAELAKSQQDVPAHPLATPSATQ